MCFVLIEVICGRLEEGGGGATVLSLGVEYVSHYSWLYRREPVSPPPPPRPSRLQSVPTRSSRVLSSTSDVGIVTKAKVLEHRGSSTRAAAWHACVGYGSPMLLVLHFGVIRKGQCEAACMWLGGVDGCRLCCWWQWWQGWCGIHLQMQMDAFSQPRKLLCTVISL